MSHITEFSVAGLAGRTGVISEKLDRNVNVFFGENGSGKTSLLKILHSAISGDVSVLARVPFQKASVDVYSVTYQKVFRRTIEAHSAEQQTSAAKTDFTRLSLRYALKQPILLSQPTADVEYIDAGNTPEWYVVGQPFGWSSEPALPEGKSDGFVDRYLPTSRVYQNRNTRQFQLSGTTLSESQLDSYFADSIRQLWTSYSSDVTTAVNQAQEKGLANILKAVLSGPKVKGEDVVDPATAYSRVSAFLGRQPGFSRVLGSLEDFSKRYARDAQLKSIVRDIDRVEKEIEGATAPRQLLKTLIQRMFSRKQVQFSDKNIEIETGDHIKIDLSDLSSGEKQLLRILIETLLAGENTILIDEPELSMHIDWQRSLVQAMRHLNPSAQIILATHSPEIMAELKDELIYRI